MNNLFHGSEHFKADKWTTVASLKGNVNVVEVWAVWDSTGNLVALGSKPAMIEYASTLNSNKGVIA